MVAWMTRPDLCGLARTEDARARSGPEKLQRHGHCDGPGGPPPPGAGFGAVPDELAAASAAGYDATVSSLISGLAAPDRGPTPSRPRVQHARSGGRSAAP